MKRIIKYAKSIRACDKFLFDIEIYTLIAYIICMKAVFVELPAFQRYREQYMDDDALRIFQVELIRNPKAGDVIASTGGLRKVRFGDPRRGKGKRGGLRIIYYWWLAGHQFWLFTLYDKDEMDDLNAKERKALSDMLQHELQARKL